MDLDALNGLPRCDAVVAGDVLEHLIDPRRMLRLIFEALPPGGVLLLSVPNVANVTVRIGLLLGRWDYGDRGILDRTHRTFFTRRSLCSLLRDHGFEISTEVTSPIPMQLALAGWPRFARLLAVIARALNALRPTLFGYQVLVRARRPAVATRSPSAKALWHESQP